MTLIDWLVENQGIGVSLAIGTIIFIIVYFFIIRAKKKIEKQDKIEDKLPPLTPDESLIFEALEPYPIHIDDIARKISMEPGKLSSLLLQLELRGIVQQSPGKLFSIIENI